MGLLEQLNIMPNTDWEGHSCSSHLGREEALFDGLIPELIIDEGVIKTIQMLKKIKRYTTADINEFQTPENGIKNAFGEILFLGYDPRIMENSLSEENCIEEIGKRLRQGIEIKAIIQKREKISLFERKFGENPRVSIYEINTPIKKAYTIYGIHLIERKMFLPSETNGTKEIYRNYIFLPKDNILEKYRGHFKQQLDLLN